MTSVQELEKIATDLRNNGKGKEAAECYGQAKKHFEDAGDELSAARMQHMIGVSYKVDNDISVAIEEHNKAVKLFEELGDRVAVGSVYRDIAMCHAYKHNYDTALKWLERAKNEQGDEDGPELGITVVKTGLMHLKNGDYEESEKMLQKGLETIRHGKNWFYEMTALMHTGELFLATKNHVAAITNFWAAVGLIYFNTEQNGMQRRLAQLYGYLSQGYLALGCHDNAKEIFSSAMKITATMNHDAAKVVYDDIKAEEFLNKLRVKDLDFHNQYLEKVK